jgi:hypothetical protein
VLRGVDRHCLTKGLDPLAQEAVAEFPFGPSAQCRESIAEVALGSRPVLRKLLGRSDGECFAIGHDGLGQETNSAVVLTPSPLLLQSVAEVVLGRCPVLGILSAGDEERLTKSLDGLCQELGTALAIGP